LQKRYQVFVSSTFSDLKDERKSIIEELLNANHIPAGMELFTASTDDQFKYIKKIIDNCDYYILIIGARYGSINQKSGISFTQMEYEYAVSINLPILAFIHSDPSNLPSDKSENGKQDQLQNFRDIVQLNRLCKMWNTKSDLVLSVIHSMAEIIKSAPQPGWVRGGSSDSSELLSNVNTLKINNLANGADVYSVCGKERSRAKRGLSNSEYKIDLSWDEIFSAIGPYLHSPKNYAIFSHNFLNSINSAFKADFYTINQDCIQTIKTQLNALGLISIQSETSTNIGIGEYIKLTPYGESYLIQLKSIKK
jgi:hypothetical protein